MRAAMLTGKRLTSVCLLILLALSACDRTSRDLHFVTPASPVDREIAQELTSLLNGESSFHLTMTASPMAGRKALEAIANGDADIALVSNYLEFRDDIATIMPLYPTVLHIAHRSGIDVQLGPEMFRGSTVYAGEKGSASRQLFERIAKTMGLGRGEYEYIDNFSSLPDVAVVFGPISPERFLDFPDYLLSSLGTPQDIGSGGVIDAAVLLNPSFRSFVIPEGTYGPATPGPVVTVAVDKMLVARSDLDETIIYDLVNDVLRLRPALAGKRPGIFHQLTEDFDTSRSTFIVHPGTQAYLQRSEPSVYERYSGVAEVVVTVLIALVSTLIAVLGIIRARRKNRIDRFYLETIKIRNTCKASTNPVEIQQAISKIEQLQDEAFDLLVHEKLSADESFRIFVTLTNDVLGQLKTNRSENLKTGAYASD
jgi:TRAP-type uncharacterized transport system substrate-binding protein